MQKITRSWTFWFTSIALMFGLLQFVPFLGTALSLLAFVFSLNSILLAAILIAFTIECLMGVFPRRLAALPLVLVGVGVAAYASNYFSARLAVSKVEAILQQRNAQAPTITFDPQSQSLGMPGTDGSVLLYDNVPAIYDILGEGAKQRTVKYTIKPRRNCHPAQLTDPLPKDRLIRAYRVSSSHPWTTLCVTTTSDKPSGQIVQIRSEYGSQEKMAGLDVTTQFRTATIDGQEVARYIGGFVDVPGPLPWATIGCAFNDSPSVWRCGAFFFPQRVKLDGIPGPRSLADTSIEEYLLQLVPRTPDEISDLTSPT